MLKKIILLCGLLVCSSESTILIAVLSSIELSDSCLNKAYSFEENGSYERAFRYYQEAVRFNDQNHNALIKLADYYQNGIHVAQNSFTAFAFYERAKDANPTHAALWNNLGVRYLNGIGTERKFKRAVHYFNKAIELDSEYSDALTNMGVCCQLGIVDESGVNEAFAWYHRAINVSNPSIYAFKNIASFYLSGICTQKDVPRAIEYLKKVIEIYPTDHLSCYAVWYYYTYHNMPQEAAQYTNWSTDNEFMKNSAEMIAGIKSAISWQ